MFEGSHWAVPPQGGGWDMIVEGEFLKAHKQ